MPRKEDLHRINEKIRDVTNVRVVGEGVEQGLFSIEKALEIAKEAGLDLVEIVPNADPPVCRVVEYKKFLYEQKKKQKERANKETKSNEIQSDESSRERNSFRSTHR